jgi:rubrerythrin
MDTRESQNAILEMLAENEENVGRLYTAYAGRFPDRREFWSGLADEERLHATWIRMLKEMMLGGQLLFNAGRFDSAAIKTFSDQIESEIAKTASAGLSLSEALAAALSIEENLVESKYFEALESDSPVLQRLLKDLETATREHGQRIREEKEALSGKL